MICNYFQPILVNFLFLLSIHLNLKLWERHKQILFPLDERVNTLLSLEWVNVYWCRKLNSFQGCLIWNSSCNLFWQSYATIVGRKECKWVKNSSPLLVACNPLFSHLILLVEECNQMQNKFACPWNIFYWCSSISFSCSP